MIVRDTLPALSVLRAIGHATGASTKINAPIIRPRVGIQI